MPRRRIVAIGLLALVLAAAPFLPDSDGPEGALTPAGDSARPRTAAGTAAGTAAATAAGANAVDPRMQAEIDRVVAEGLARPALRGRPGPQALASQQIRCARFEGLTYCLHLGWVDGTEAQARARVAAAARTVATRPSAAGTGAAGATPVESTGDLDPLAPLDTTSVPAARARADSERDELTRAARAVAKVWTLRHEVLGVPYPRGFWSRHPEARPAAPPTAALRAATASPSASPTKSASPSATASTPASTSATAGPSATSGPKTAADYPDRDEVLSPDETAEQIRNYWCGPTAMQMIAWGWRGERRSQRTWAARLGTTTGGTDIGAIVDTINDYTGWDGTKYAGPYVTLDVGSFSYARWYLLLMRHIHDYRAPVVLHPILLKQYYPYLDDDASGHYQVGRGYAQRGDRPNLIGYFEPWNQQRFDFSEPYIERVQWRRAYRSYRANLAHPYHNIGV